jgi:ferredoxin
VPRDEQPFEVVCVRSGVTLTVPPNRSIASVAAERGIHVIAWCAEGVCGTCETAVLAGRPDHRDSLLSEEERAASRTMLICVSRCQRGPLVLEL